MPEHPGAYQVADEDSGYSIHITYGDRGGEETIVGSCQCHHQIACQEIGLRHRQIAILVWLRTDEIEYGWGTLHSEESSHQSAQCSCRNLHGQRSLHLDALAEEGEVDAHDDQRNTEQYVQYVIFHPLEHEDGSDGNDDEGEQNGQQPPPGDVLVFLNNDDQGGGHRQNAREGCCLTEGRHDRGEHRHDEDAKTEASGALYKTGSDAQQEEFYYYLIHSIVLFI